MTFSVETALAATGKIAGKHNTEGKMEPWDQFPVTSASLLCGLTYDLIG